MILEWAKDNDQDVYIEGLPTGLTLSAFVSNAKTQTAVALSGLSSTPVWGTYDIPATYDAAGVELTPARPSVACYKAPFEGDAITANAPVDTLLYLIVREGANVRVYAELYVRESRAAIAASGA